MLTIGIVVHSQPEYSEYCVRKIYASSLIKRGLASVVVVANDPDPETNKKIEQLYDEFGFLCLHNTTDRGYGSACNQILEQAHTPYIVFLHNDVLVTERTFEHLVEHLEQVDDEVAVTLPSTNYANEHFVCINAMREKFLEYKPSNKQHYTKENIEHVLTQVYGNLEEFALRLESDTGARAPEYQEEMSSFCQMFRTKALRTVGGFSEEFPSRGFEDKELHLRLVQSEFKVTLTHKAFVHHHGNMTTDGEGREYPAQMETNYQIYKQVLEKHKAIDKRTAKRKIKLVTGLGSFRKHIRKIDDKRKKRILYFGSHYPPENAGGAELSFHNTAKQLLQYDIEIAAFTIRNRYHKKFHIHRSFEHEGVRVLQVPEDNGEQLMRKFALFVEQFEPDLVYGHSIWSYYAFKYLEERHSDIKRIFAFRHQTDITDGRMSEILRNDGRLTVIANSKWMQKVLREKCSCDSVLVYPAVYPRQCQVPPEQHNPKAVVIGNGVLSKGVQDFLSVARLLPEIEFHIFGSFDSSIPKHMIPSNVILKGWTTDLSEIYKEAKVVVNMSIDPEPFGRTLVEAMYNRIPVIAYNRGGPKEIVGEGGCLVETPDDFVAAIERLYSEDELYDHKVASIANDLAWYNPYAENDKLLRVILDQLGTTMIKDFVF